MGQVGISLITTVGIVSTTCKIVITSDSTQSLSSVDVGSAHEEGLTLTWVLPDHPWFQVTTPLELIDPAFVLVNSHSKLP